MAQHELHICMVTCLYMMVFRFKVPNVGCPSLEALVSDLEAACFFLARGGGVVTAWKISR